MFRYLSLWEIFSGKPLYSISVHQRLVVTIVMQSSFNPTSKASIVFHRLSNTPWILKADHFQHTVAQNIPTKRNGSIVKKCCTKQDWHSRINTKPLPWQFPPCGSRPFYRVAYVHQKAYIYTTFHNSIKISYKVATKLTLWLELY